MVKADQSDAVITLSGLTVRNGKTTGGDNIGGGINNESTMTLLNSVVSGNTALSASPNLGRGGGVANFGTLTVLNSTIRDNVSLYTGGGIHNSGTLTVLNSTISNNRGQGAGGAIGSQG
ncbi:MAG: hypothetical protein NTZ05_01170, partial [Chloroflexi bacterium]|nr:hypothetical protein [Chloroflexota bacterium]